MNVLIRIALVIALGLITLESDAQQGKYQVGVYSIEVIGVISGTVNGGATFFNATKEVVDFVQCSSLPNLIENALKDDGAYNGYIILTLCDDGSNACMYTDIGSQYGVSVWEYSSEQCKFINSHALI